MMLITKICEGYGNTVKTCKYCGKEFPETTEYFYLWGKGRGFRPKCKECYAKYRASKKEEIKAYNKAYKKEHRGGILEKQRIYRIKNSEKIQEYREKNKQRIKERSAQYRAANKEKISLYHKEYYEENRDKCREYGKFYAATHTDDTRIRKHRYNSRKCGVRFDIAVEDIENLQKKFNGCCAYCGIPSKSLTIDHIIPMSSGGETTINNLVLACRSCNSSKHTADFASWYKTQPFFSEERFKAVNDHMEAK